MDTIKLTLGSDCIRSSISVLISRGNENLYRTSTIKVVPHGLSFKLSRLIRELRETIANKPIRHEVCAGALGRVKPVH